MPAWQRTYLAVCSGIIGFALAYVLCDYAAWPRLIYFPVAHAWRLAVPSSDPVPMGYVGMILWGVGGALGAGLGSYTLLGLARRAWSDRWLRIAGGWAVTAFAYAGLYYTWNLWPF